MYRTVSVSTNVCCLVLEVISLGKAARRPSTLIRDISTNCRETIGLVPFWQRMDADNTTIVTVV